MGVVSVEEIRELSHDARVQTRIIGIPNPIPGGLSRVIDVDLGEHRRTAFVGLKWALTVIQLTVYLEAFRPVSPRSPKAVFTLD